MPRNVNVDVLCAMCTVQHANATYTSAAHNRIANLQATIDCLQAQIDQLAYVVCFNLFVFINFIVKL
jgi:hypothetical protein